MRQLITFCLCAAFIVPVASCGGDDRDASTGAETPDGAHALPPLQDGKADNYVSTNAREFNLVGTTYVALPEGFADMEPEAQEAALAKTAEARLSTVARALRSHIEQVIRDANGGVSGEDAQYFTYFKRGAGELDGVEVLEDGRVAVSFDVELVGSYHLMSKVSPETQGQRRTFTIEVKEWPDPDGEQIEVEIKGSDSRDAFPRYDALFEDGVFDIAIHFGGDYNSERFDLDSARWTVETMIADGWEGGAPFDDLKVDSPPFTRALKVEGRALEVRVKVVHSDMVEPVDEALLSESMKASLAAADVVIYSGHAGENAGFILDYQPRHEIPARDFATLDLPEKYQIYVLDGCRTYRTYVDDLLKNPNKSFDNLDVVTTVNTTPFAVGYQVIFQFLYWFTLTDNDGGHLPLSWMTILRGVNTPDYKSVHYGVHGIDDDPKLNPHASEGIACTPCSTDADCGAGGNLCLGYGGGAACGVACTTDTACGEGYRCARLTDDEDQFYIPKQCVRRDYVCL